MLTALSTAVSALDAQAVAVDVVGNNLANLNTTGYKASSTLFHDMMSQTLGSGSSTQVGMGVGTPITQRIFSQGNLQSSSGPLDVAIQNDGFLVVSKTPDGKGGVEYTRAGNLKMDKEGYLRTATGEYVQGYMAANGQINAGGTPTNMQVQASGLKPGETTQNIFAQMNLDVTAVGVATQNLSAQMNFDSAAALNATANFGPFQVTDSQGQSHTVNLQVEKTVAGPPDTWTVTPVSSEGTASFTSPLTLTFDGTGNLTSPAAGDPVPQVQITGLPGGANDMKMNLPLFRTDGTALAAQSGAATSASSLTSDGSRFSKTPASIQVFDSLGQPHTVSLNVTKTGQNTWTLAASVPSEDTGNPVTIGGVSDITLTFDSNGKLVSPGPGSTPQIKITGLTDGASDMSINLPLFGTDGTPLITNLAAETGASSTGRDGRPATSLNGVSITDGGYITGEYSDGSMVQLGQLALATFRNPDSLVSVGNNNYAASGETSGATVGAPGTGGRGQILGKQLESSTVDIAHEFTQLMVLQRSYQANARVVTSVDQILQETINIKQ